MKNLKATCHDILNRFPQSIGCTFIKNFSFGVELELQGIALQRCSIGILFVFLKAKIDIVFFAQIKHPRIGIGILWVCKSLQYPTLHWICTETYSTKKKCLRGFCIWRQFLWVLLGLMGNNASVYVLIRVVPSIWSMGGPL